MLYNFNKRAIKERRQFQTKLNNELFNKALNAYAADKKKNLSNLPKYAKEMRVYKKLMDMLNG